MKHFKRAVFVFAVSMIPMIVSAVEPEAAADDTRYGLFGGLDHRSAYTENVFPEPFLVDDSALEVNEARLDWLHTSAGSSHSDFIKAEIEKGFGLLTVELEVPYERDVADGDVFQGMANIDLGARYPFYQVVSRLGFVDSTLGGAIEVGIPTGSEISKNTELVPKIFEDLKIGDFTVQSVLGYSALFGPGDDGGLRTFEYGFVFGCTIDERQLRLPGMLSFVPMFELSGETPLNHDEAGHNSLTGNAAIRFNLRPIGRVQPRLGVGYVFPVNRNARADVHHGIFTSLVFEY